jgi:formamidopyrimidine-DNA glycosylase
VPELPEVEHAARELRRWATGRRILRVETDGRARRLFRPAAPAALARALRGRAVAGVERIGKQILVTLDGPEPLGLLSHLGMTGKWLRRGPGDEPPGHSRARLFLDDGATLHYRDPRLFGRMRLVPGADFAALPEIRALGPDPIRDGVRAAPLARALSRTARPVKVALLDQRLLAGVGNIYASEALFQAGLDPRRPGRDLSAAEVVRLARALALVLRRALARDQGPEIAYVEEGGLNRFRVYAREGERCPRCRGGLLLRLVQAQRSTFFCPRCQR